jgi:hypothetical protein
MLIRWQSYHDPEVCIPGIAMSGGDGMDSTLEYILSDVHGFLLLCPFMLGGLQQNSLSHRITDNSTSREMDDLNNDSSYIKSNDSTIKLWLQD